jgi:hypothetical protein
LRERQDDEWIVLRGWSMSPALRDGDELRVAGFTEADPPRAGEIVIARRGQRLVTHRLVAIADGYATTRPDLGHGDDPPIPVDALVGRVVGVRRKRLRRWMRWLRRS